MIIGLGHRARQGKDEIGKVLQKEFGFQVVHFADALKRECRDYFDWSEDNKNILARDAITASKLARVAGTDDFTVGTEGVWVSPDTCIEFGDYTLLQWWGTQFRRWQDDDYWVKRTVNDIAKSGFAPTVICDMRFPNEANAVKMLNGATVRLQRIMPNGKQFISPDRDPNHASEIGLLDYPFDYSMDIDDMTDKSEVVASSAFHRAAVEILAQTNKIKEAA